MVEMEGMIVTVNPNAFTEESYLIITPTPPSLIARADVQSSSIVSSVVDIKVFNGALTSSVKLCFDVTDGSVKREETCLGFIDESVRPPIWKCQDRCLRKENARLCGRTEHFTSFAVLFGGIARGGGCHDDGDYILGDFDLDLILVGSVAGFVILLALLFIILFSFTPLRKYMLGEEGRRIASLRSRSHLPRTELTELTTGGDA